METISAEEMRENFIDLMQRVQKDNNQFRIISDQGTAILLSEETYKNLIVTLEVFATPGLIDSLTLDKNSS